MTQPCCGPQPYRFASTKLAEDKLVLSFCIVLLSQPTAYNSDELLAAISRSVAHKKLSLSQLSNVHGLYNTLLQNAAIMSCLQRIQDVEHICLLFEQGYLELSE